MPLQPKILLIFPTTQGAVQTLFTHHEDKGIGDKPPLGILTLATFLKQNGFENVHCLDANLLRLSPQKTAETVSQMQPDVVGITAWTDFWYPVKETIQEIKRLLPQCPVILGGPHCSIYPELSLEYSEADYLIAGDGEEPLLSFVQAISHDQPLEKIPGLWIQKDARIVPPDQKLSILTDASIIPSPDRTLLPYKKYSSILGQGQYETTMMTSRGCPHKCVFCKIHAQKISSRPAESVISEFKEIAELGIHDIQVYDDTFTWSKDRVMEICQGIIDNKLELRWAIRDRVSKADPEMYALLRQAGCYRIHFGVETGSPRILKSSGKGITLEQAVAAHEMARNADMESIAFFMFGFLDETLEDARETIRFSKRLDPDYAVFMILIPYPGTTIYGEALERGIIKRDHWAEYIKSPVPNYQIPCLIEQEIPRKTLTNLKAQAHRSFYLRPRVILRELLKVRRPQDLLKRSTMALRLLMHSDT